MDDTLDFRPGARVLREMGIYSPLQMSGFSKKDIRRASGGIGLRTWNMEPSPCLATRIPYGQKITKRSLLMVERAETYVRSLGAVSVRVRCEGPTARIEVNERYIPLLVKKRKTIIRRLKEMGFLYISVDLSGYRCGAMNEAVVWIKKR